MNKLSSFCKIMKITIFYQIHSDYLNLLQKHRGSQLKGSSELRSCTTVEYKLFQFFFKLHFQNFK